jgi:hypothetical protein
VSKVSRLRFRGLCAEVEVSGLWIRARVFCGSLCCHLSICKSPDYVKVNQLGEVLLKVLSRLSSDCPSICSKTTLSLFCCALAQGHPTSFDPRAAEFRDTRQGKHKRTHESI